MTRLTDRPPHHVVMAAIRKEAAAANVDEALIINPNYRAPVVAEARRHAIRRIINETGCSHAGLSTAWGLTKRTIAEAMGTLGSVPRRTNAGPVRKEPEGRFGPYDPNTAIRLAWAHGEAKAAQIVSGGDPATQADIARWRSLGTGGAAA